MLAGGDGAAFGRVSGIAGQSSLRPQGSPIEAAVGYSRCRKTSTRWRVLIRSCRLPRPTQSGTIVVPACRPFTAARRLAGLRMKHPCLVVFFLTAGVASAAAPVEKPTYEKHVRPILKAYCFECHGEGEKLRAGL